MSWMYFHHVTIISPWKYAWAIIWTNLNSLFPRIICIKLSWNWRSGSRGEHFSKFVNIMSLCCYYAMIDPITQRWYMPSLVKFKWWFWRSNQFILTISLLSPFAKGHDPSFEQNWNRWLLNGNINNIIIF